LFPQRILRVDAGVSRIPLILMAPPWHTLRLTWRCKVDISVRLVYQAYASFVNPPYAWLSKR